MPRKLNVVVQDILALLQKTEPDMLLWREIKERVWPLHKTRYKDKKVFSVALSNYLTKQEGKLWKQEGDYWGTLKSSPPKEPLPKSTSRMRGSLIPQFWKEREEALELCSKGVFFKAYEKTLQFIGTLPSPSKKRLTLDIKKVEDGRAEIRNKLVYMKNLPWRRSPGWVLDPFREEKERDLLRKAVPYLWEQIASVLYQC